MTEQELCERKISKALKPTSTKGSSENTNINIKSRCDELIKKSVKFRKSGFLAGNTTLVTDINGNQYDIKPDIEWANKQQDEFDAKKEEEEIKRIEEGAREESERKQRAQREFDRKQQETQRNQQAEKRRIEALGRFKKTPGIKNFVRCAAGEPGCIAFGDLVEPDHTARQNIPCKPYESAGVKDPNMLSSSCMKVEDKIYSNRITVGGKKSRGKKRTRRVRKTKKYNIKK